MPATSRTICIGSRYCRTNARQRGSTAASANMFGPTDASREAASAPDRPSRDRRRGGRVTSAGASACQATAASAAAGRRAVRSRGVSVRGWLHPLSLLSGGSDFDACRVERHRRAGLAAQQRRRVRDGADRRRPPVCSTNEQAARTFGPIEPAANSRRGQRLRRRRGGSRAAPACPSRSRRRRRRSRSASASACRSWASSALARSLSITASTPTSRRPAGAGSSVYMTGIPPPPAQITTQPCSSSHSTGSTPKIRCGSGEGTTRRKLSPSGLNSHPFSFASRAASSFVVDRPDRLRRIPERGVVAVDLDQRQQRGEALLQRQLVSELLLDQVADHALGLGAEQVERIRRRPPCRPSPAGRAGRPAARCRAR